MGDSMLSNVKLTLKEVVPTTASATDTFYIFETGIVATNASVVFSNKSQLERFVLDIATDGECTIVYRALDNSQTKTEVPGEEIERGVGSEGYITVLASDIFDVDSTGLQILSSPFKFEGAVEFTSTVTVSSTGELIINGKSNPFPVVADDAARDALYPSPGMGDMCINNGEVQKYNTGTSQRETLDVGTPSPNASTTVKGISQEATDIQVGNSTEIGSTGARLFINPKTALKESGLVYTPAYLTGGSSATARGVTWTAVTDGSFSIDIDGVTVDVTGLDFSATTDEDDIAAVIQTGIRTETSSTETCVRDTDHFVITSADTTSSSAITVTSAEGTGTDISGAGATEFMDCETGQGTVTDAVSDITEDKNKIPVIDDTGKLDEGFIPDISKSIGAGVSKSDNTVYQADTDGFFVAWINEDIPETGEIAVAVYVDDTDATTLVGRSGASTSSNITKGAMITYPIASGEYYKAVGSTYSHSGTATYHKFYPLS